MLQSCIDQGQPAALVTLLQTDGPSPRDPGAQMLVSGDQVWGYLSGGCVEADIAQHARDVIISGEPKTLVYGKGSPWLDIRLACGSSITVRVERILADNDPARQWCDAYYHRRGAIWSSGPDGFSCRDIGADKPLPFSSDGIAYHLPSFPPIRLMVVGRDAIALETARLAAEAHFDVLLCADGGPEQGPDIAGINYHAGSAAGLFANSDVTDPWTAVAILSHESEREADILPSALYSPAFYVGAIGSRRRLADRQAMLRMAGVEDKDIARLHMPIGMDGLGKLPQAVAIAILAEVQKMAARKVMR